MATQTASRPRRKARRHPSGVRSASTPAPLFATPRPKERREFWFDREAAEKAIDWFPKHLQHVSGPYAGQPFVLEPWQEEITSEIFGWKRREDDMRLIREVYVEVSRGTGKSTYAAGLANRLTFGDHEQRAEVYSAAGDRNQARIVFDIARDMVRQSPTLAPAATIRHNAILYPRLLAKYQPISAEAGLQHGLNIHAAVGDEIHIWPNRELYDVLKTSMVKRRQPLLFLITTAGIGQTGICYELHDYTVKLAKGLVSNPRFFGRIYAAAPEDPWDEEETWRKANPGLGVTISLEDIRAAAEEAKQMPTAQNAFRRLHLCQWTSTSTRYIDMRHWDASAGTVDAEDLRGRPCYGGLDLASTVDLAAFVLLFPPENGDGVLRTLPFFWIPEDEMHQRYLRDRVPYPTWVEEGLVEATPGNVIDYSYIRHRINALGKRYRIREIGFDPHNALHLVQELEADGFVMPMVRQGFLSLSGPTKELLRLVLAGKLAHGGNPVLRWMADNFVVRTDVNENLAPDREKKIEKIDGIVALIMALRRFMDAEQKVPRPSLSFVGGSYDR